MEVCSTVGVSSVLPTIALPGKKTLAKPKTPQKAVISCTLTQPPQLHSREDPIIHSSRRGLLGLIGSFSLGTLLQDSFSSSSYAEASTISSCDFTVAPSGLAFCDISLGSGLPASKGMPIKANYVGKLEDGKVFDSSYDRGKPFTFKVGVGQVIKGWDEGILGGEGVPPMLAGGKRTLRIPSSLGYGERGAGCRGGSCLIPPNSVLLFDVEFIGKAY